MHAASLVYVLCLAASLTCATLLLKSFAQTRSRLLFWTALGFCAITVNNLLLVADMLVWRGADLWALRQIPAGVGIALFLYGFLWEIER